MTQIEERVRSGLEAEAEAIAKAARSAQSTSGRQRIPLSGAAVALVAAAVVLVIFGGLSLLTGGGGVVDEPATTSSSLSSSDTSVPSVDEDGLFEAVPFTGETWQFTVSEETNPSLGTYEVCFGLDPVGGASDPSVFGPPWCDDWPDPRVDADLIGVHHVLPSDTSVVLVVDLNDQPVDRVAVTGEGIDETITPFALPGSGKQFAVVEVPQTAGMLTVEALDTNGTVLDRPYDICGGDRFERGTEVCPDFEGPLLEGGTPVDESTVSEVATMMGGEPLSDEELEQITGSAGLAHSGYLIESTTTPDGSYELGLIIYREQHGPVTPSLICFSEFAITQGVNVGGGAVCADNQEKAEELATFHLSGGGACGAIPKEEPVVEGNWMTLAVWGVPESAETLSVGLGDGATVEIDVRNGVALHLWEGSAEITSIEFDGITETQRELVSSYLPVTSIGDDCGRGDTSGG